jgi:hypothetical protein
MVKDCSLFQNMAKLDDLYLFTVTTVTWWSGCATARPRSPDRVSTWRKVSSPTYDASSPCRHGSCDRCQLLFNARARHPGCKRFLLQCTWHWSSTQNVSRAREIDGYFHFRCDVAVLKASRMWYKGKWPRVLRRFTCREVEYEWGFDTHSRGRLVHLTMKKKSY